MRGFDMKVFRATFITALITLFFAAGAVSAQDTDDNHTKRLPNRYTNKEYGFSFYTINFWKMYNTAGMEAKLKQDAFRRYGAPQTLGFTKEDVENKRALLFAEIKTARGGKGRFDQLRYMGVVFGSFEEIEERYGKLRGQTFNGKEEDVYDSCVETERSFTPDKKESEYFTPDGMDDSSGKTYRIRQRIYFISLPGDKAVMLTFGARSEEADKYFDLAQAWFDDGRFKVKWPDENKGNETALYQNDALGISFKIDKAWKELSASDIKNSLENSKIFFDFVSSEDIEKGRVVLLTPGDTDEFRQHFWAAPTLMIVVHDKPPFIDEDFRRSREDKISYEIDHYMKRTGNIVSQIDEIKDIKVCRVAVAGESYAVKDDSDDVLYDKQKIKQVFYYMPMGARGVTFVFSFPESAGYSQEKIEDFTQNVCEDIEGLQVKKVETDTSYYLLGAGIIIVAVIVFFVFLIRARIKRMQRRLGKRTYEHTGFKPKKLTLQPKKTAPGRPESGPKKPPQG